MITCPTRVLWSQHDDLAALHGSPFAIWRSWCRDVDGASIDAGHHMAEDNPEALAGSLIEFLGRR